MGDTLINLNQIRPGTNGQFISTVGGIPAWTAGTSTNIYNTDGTLTSNRTISGDGKNFNINNTLNSVIESTVSSKIISPLFTVNNGADNTLQLKNTGELILDKYTGVNFNGTGRRLAVSATGNLVRVQGVTSAESSSVSTTSLLTWVNKLTVGYVPDVIGLRKVTVSYAWAYDNGGRSFNSRLTLNGTQLNSAHIQTPAGSSLSQRNYTTRTFVVNFTTTALQTLILEYAASNSGDIAQISDAIMIIETL